MAMHGFTVLVLLALLAAPAPAMRDTLTLDEVSLESQTVQHNTVARQESAQLQNNTAERPEGWVHRKVREAWGQGDLPGRVLQAAARRVSAGVSMLQDSERLGANLSGHATRIAASGISVLQHGAGRLGHLLKFGRVGLVQPVREQDATPTETAAAGNGAVSTPSETVPATTEDLEEKFETEIEKDLGASPQQVKMAETGSYEYPLVQILFALMYYFFVARVYPKLPEGVEISQEVSEFQQQNILTVPCNGRWENVFLACCCPVARAAHTMDATGTMDYWPSCVLMTICACPTLWLAHSRSDLQAKLGTAPRGCFMDCLCVTFCTCCVISQDAIALDMITGARTGICGVTPPPTASQPSSEPPVVSQ